MVDYAVEHPKYAVLVLAFLRATALTTILSWE